MRRPLPVVFLAVLLLAASPPAAVRSDLGTVEFESSGSPAAQEPFLRGVAALHSFWYPEAADLFRQAQQIEPGFALAYWGEALTHDHPLWEQQDRAEARSILARLAPTAAERRAKAPTGREKAYLDTVEILFAEEGDREQRHRAYSAALRRLSEGFPEDEDAAALFALSLQAIAPRGAEGSRTRMESAAVLEGLLDRHPRHPGVLHYLIHAYDDPVHAPLGLRPALVYAGTAPAAPHALHMPSHIFVQLGLWDRVASSNTDAYQASVDWVERKGLPRSEEDFHSLSWLHYAYLQLGRYREAAETLDTIGAAEAASPDHWTARYRSSMLARQVLETGDAEAMHGGERVADWKIADATAPVAFAVGWAAVRLDDLERAHAAVARLHDLAVVEEGGDSRASETAVRVMVHELKGLVALAEGRTDQGVGELELAAELESGMPMPSGPPNPPKPAHELLGEVLLDLGRAEEAAASFESALLRTPKRAASLLGGARAAAARGDAEAAGRFYAELAVIWSRADAGHPGAAETRAALDPAPS